MTTVLSAREGAGLYLVRRARTVVGPHQLRILATAFLALLLVDLGRLTLGRTGTGISWAAVGCESLVYLALITLLWRPVTGLALAALSLTLAGLAGGTGTEPLVLLLVGAIIFSRGGRSARRWALAGSVTYVLVTAALHTDHLGFIAFWFGGAAAVGTAIGEFVRRANRRWGRAGRDAAVAVTESARLRADERRLLTRELHDVVTHQLSNVTLQVMSQQQTSDPEQLRRALLRIGGSTEAALRELRLLVRVLRDDSATAAGADEVAELTQRVTPTAAAADWARRLTSAGFDPDVTVPARADRLGMTVQRTLTRALDAAGDNILRYATPRTPCSLTITIKQSDVLLQVASRVSGRPAAPAYGWALRGLRERVDLTGGTFSAGPSGGDLWVVAIGLPYD